LGSETKAANPEVDRRLTLANPFIFSEKIIFIVRKFQKHFFI
jgi:hypothetical protein